MAITLTVSGLSRDVTAKRIHRGKIVTAGAYVSGGFDVAPGDLALHTIEQLLVTPPAGLLAEYYPATGKVKLFSSAGFTPTGSVAAPVFTGSALAAHRHVLHFQTSAAANAVTAAANSLRTAAAAFDVAGVANSSGEGGIVDVTGGTPAGTNSAPAFTGDAVAAAALTEYAGTPNATLYFTAIGT